MPYTFESVQLLREVDADGLGPPATSIGNQHHPTLDVVVRSAEGVSTWSVSQRPPMAVVSWSTADGREAVYQGLCISIAHSLVATLNLGFHGTAVVDEAPIVDVQQIADVGALDRAGASLLITIAEAGGTAGTVIVKGRRQGYYSGTWAPRRTSVQLVPCSGQQLWVLLNGLLGDSDDV